MTFGEIIDTQRNEYYDWIMVKCVINFFVHKKLMI